MKTRSVKSLDYLVCPINYPLVCPEHYARILWRKRCHELVRIPYRLSSGITESIESEVLHDRTSDDSVHCEYRGIQVMTQYDYLAVSGPNRARDDVSIPAPPCPYWYPNSTRWCIRALFCPSQRKRVARCHQKAPSHTPSQGSPQETKRHQLYVQYLRPRSSAQRRYRTFWILILRAPTFQPFVATTCILVVIIGGRFRRRQPAAR